MIDTLVHNWMHRTGILRALQAEHPYSPPATGLGVVPASSSTSQAGSTPGRFNPAFPSVFPRYVQIAIWGLCAQSGLGICNGLTIDDRTRCANADCSLFKGCDHVPLRWGWSQGDAA